MDFITINTRTTGKFKKKKIGGRDHIITSMRPIRGNTAMNGILYPDIEVQKSFMQFDNMLAPSKHPKINGQNVSAFHPMAINSHNIGGFTQNPKKKGKDVFVDFVLDIEVANNTDDGKELIRRIENGEKVGVSTGLTINRLTPKKGKDDFGKDFTNVGEGFEFDHIAILLNEEAAGGHAGTELITNSDLDEDITIINLDKMTVTNELTVHELRNQLEALVDSETGTNHQSFIEEIFIDSRSFIFASMSNPSHKLFKQSFAVDDSDTVSLVDDRKEVKKEITFVEVTQNTDHEVDEMDKKLFIMALRANGVITNSEDELTAMSETELATLFKAKPVSVENAKEVLTKDGFDFTGYDNFVAKKEVFNTFETAEETRLNELREGIIANSDYTTEMLTGKSEDELKVLQSMSTNKKPTKRIGAGVIHQTNSSDDVELDFN